MVGEEFRPVRSGPHFISGLFPAQGGSGKTGPDFHALCRRNGHHGGGQLCIQLAIDRLTPAGRNSRYVELNDGAGRRPFLPQQVQPVCPRLDDTGVRRKERVAADFIPVPRRPVGRQVAQLDQGCANPDRRAEHLTRHGTGSDPGGGFTG